MNLPHGQFTPISTQSTQMYSGGRPSFRGQYFSPKWGLNSWRPQTNNTLRCFHNSGIQSYLGAGNGQKGNLKC